MAIIFFALAVSMALATFVESAHGIPAAWALVYDAWWFELLWGLFALNLVSNLFKYRLLNRRRLPVGLFHIAFLFILSGAAITRWFGYEGIMTIREMERADFILSAESYFYAEYEGQGKEAEVLLSELTPGQFQQGFDVNGQTLSVRTVGFVPHAGHDALASPAVASDAGTYEQAVMVEVAMDGIRKVIPLYGDAGIVADTIEEYIGEGVLKLAYGAKVKPLPFGLELQDFVLERYPGSQSPSSYTSQVVLIDEEDGVHRQELISVNNPLRYKGYKIFQASFDPDEKGTVLLVSHDFWGTWISYLGYLLMTLGIVFSLISRHSYFRQLMLTLKNNPAKTILLGVLLSGASSGALAQSPAHEVAVPEKQVVERFGQLWVQGIDGRIKPLSTLAGEVVRKVTRKSRFDGFSPDEMIMGMMAFPRQWQQVPFIKVANPAVAADLGIDNDYVSLRQLFDARGNYRLAGKVQAAFSKPAALRNRVEKEYIYLDERVSICFMVFQGSLFHLFPGGNAEDPWYPPGADAKEYAGADSVFIKKGMDLLIHALSEGNEKQALQILRGIEAFQQKYGTALIPSREVKKAEILYNRANPFERLVPFYLLGGFLLLLVLFVNIFTRKPLPSLLKHSAFLFILFLFMVHTAGIILRWYISGRAPWSNGYESMVYVAWSGVLAGIVFGRRYLMVMGAASFLAGIALFVAHLSWMNPEITPLVPVLKSHWLTIHVSVITASYGFIGLSAFLGILVLVLMVLRSKSNHQKVATIISQLTTINQMSATLGLYFLAIGTFLGGIWANESWGRYWGWDPKETWSLITIIVYAFIVHMRLVPSLRGIFPFTVASVGGFASVIMTYLGVNYYLTGLHSYGNDAAGGMSPFLAVIFVLITGLMTWAYLKDRKARKQMAFPEQKPKP